MFARSGAQERFVGLAIARERYVSPTARLGPREVRLDRQRRLAQRRVDHDRGGGRRWERRWPNGGGRLCRCKRQRAIADEATLHGLTELGVCDAGGQLRRRRGLLLELLCRWELRGRGARGKARPAAPERTSTDARVCSLRTALARVAHLGTGRAPVTDALLRSRAARTRCVWLGLAGSGVLRVDRARVDRGDFFGDRLVGYRRAIFGGAAALGMPHVFAVRAGLDVLLRDVANRVTPHARRGWILAAQQPLRLLGGRQLRFTPLLLVVSRARELVDAGRLDVDRPEDELARRLEAWTPPDPRFPVVCVDETFTQLIGDVEERLFGVLPDETWVYPGHGGDTTIGAERPHVPEWRERGRRWVEELTPAPSP